MIDKKGRVWLTASVRGRDNPAFCKEGSDHPSAKLFPLKQSSRQLAVLDPKTMKYTFVDTCFQHAPSAIRLRRQRHAVDQRRRAGGRLAQHEGVRRDRRRRQGAGLDDAGARHQRQRQARRRGRAEGAGRCAEGQADRGRLLRGDAEPGDGSVWGSSLAGKGCDRPVRTRATELAEIYNVPAPGFAPRGADIDNKGVVWVSLGSGHLGSFDRKKCKGPLNGPNATGDHCPEGWSFYQYPGPGFAGIGDNSAEASYYTWVDQHNTLGLGEDVPISTGNENDAPVALVDGKWVVLRVPYPIELLCQGARRPHRRSDRRLEGPGVWTTSGDRTPWLKEGGKGTVPIAFHFQLRPDPLAE